MGGGGLASAAKISCTDLAGDLGGDADVGLRLTGMATRAVFIETFLIEWVECYACHCFNASSGFHRYLNVPGVTANNSKQTVLMQVKVVPLNS
jgi:hypothetical protein